MFTSPHEKESSHFIGTCLGFPQPTAIGPRPCPVGPLLTLFPSAHYHQFVPFVSHFTSASFSLLTTKMGMVAVRTSQDDGWSTSLVCIRPSTRPQHRWVSSPGSWWAGRVHSPRLLTGRFLSPDGAPWLQAEPSGRGRGLALTAGFLWELSSLV